MIRVETSIKGWPAETDWRKITQLVAEQAVSETHHAKLTVWAEVEAEVSVALSSDEEVRALNRIYRGKDNPTNVLSFPMFAPEEIENLAHSQLPELLLGDIVLAYETCAREAAEKGVSLEAHASHLIVHGTLHLLGYDHIDDDDAQTMEAIETAAMAALGLHRPYDE